jgi:hypothetical protein
MQQNIGQEGIGLASVKEKPMSANPMSSQVWVRASSTGDEYVELDPTHQGAGYLITVKASQSIWMEIQKLLAGDPHAQPFDMPTFAGGPTTTVMTIRPKHSADRQQAMTASESALTALGFRRI